MNDLVKAVRELASKYPNAIYPNHGACFYNKVFALNGPEEEGCIFGQVLRKLEPEIYELVKETGMRIKDIIIEYRSMSKYYDSIDWCQVVQEAQDAGISWGEAVEIADKENPFTY